MSFIKQLPIYFLYLVGIVILTILFDIVTGNTGVTIGDFIQRVFLMSVILLGYSAFKKPKKVV